MKPKFPAWGPLVAAVFLLVALSACATSAETSSNGDRQLAYQNRSAAEKILDQAAGLRATLTLAGFDGASASLIAVEWIAHAATDIRDNSSTQIKNWGGDAAIKGKAEYSSDASAAARKAADDEHARMTKWAAVIATGTAILGAVVTGIGSKIPVIGPFLGMLNFGEKKDAKLIDVLQAGADEARRKYDELADRLRKELPAEALERVAALIPNGDVLKDRLISELQRTGLLAFNTAKYEANPLIPDSPAPSPSS